MKGLRFGAVAVVVGMFGLAGCVIDGDTLDDLLDDENGGESSSDDDDGDAGKESGGDEGGAGGADTGGDQGGSTTATGGAGNEGGAATAGAAPTETGGAATAGAAPTEGGAAAAGAPVVEGGAAGAPIAAGGAVATAGAPQGGAEETGSGEIDVGETCTVTEECKPGSLCYEGTCVQTGSIRVSLSWTDSIDLDLHVQTPSGTEIYYSNKVADGGELDVDDCIGCSCREPDGVHVENIFFESAAPGEYAVWVRNYNAGGNPDPIPYSITVMVNGSPQWLGEGAVVEYASSEPYRFTY